MSKPTPSRFLFILLVLSAAASAQTITVTTVEDVTDFAPPQTAAQLPGPDGRVSFREALAAANNMPGPQTIGFAIPKADWWLVPEQALLKQEAGIFELQDDGTTVDFTTQTALTGDTNANGHEVGVYGLEPNAWGVASIYVFGNGCTIRGLDRVLQRGYAIEIWGSQNKVVGCTIDGPLYAAVYLTGPFGGAPSTGNVVGGTQPGDGNVLVAGNAGVRIDAPSESNVVIGNVLSGAFSGVEVRGSEFTTTAKFNRIGGREPGERNIISGAGHYGEEGFPVGSQVSLEWAEGTIVQGNYIGTTPDGLASAGQIGPVGIELGNNVTGTLIDVNLISGIVVPGVNHFAGQVFGTGIAIQGPASDTLIQGNLIGTDATGLAPLPNHLGIVAEPLFAGPASGPTHIGSTGPGEANTIAFNQLQGVRVASSFHGVTLSANSIHSNGLLGIDLLPQGPTPNDPLDADGGANALQNFPVLSSAACVGGQANLAGSLDSEPNHSYVIEIFASAACDPSGFGEGQTFFGAFPVETNASGHTDFAASFAAPGGMCEYFTATATEVTSGNTSEFGPCVQAGPWADLGKAKPGSTGTPKLAGSGPLTPGSSNALQLSGAAPNSTATLIVGLSEIDLPFRGGVLVPQPQFVLPQRADPTGSLLLPFTWPAGGASGLTIFLQFWIGDTVSSFGVSASNGLVGVTQ
jgi:hypothetical protein